MTSISRIFSEASELRPRVIGIYAMLIVANLAAWTCALLLFHDQPVLLGTALLAYGFGLRHAVDADYIVAIDNIICKLMQSGERPVGVGFFFALGHFTVVVLAAAVVAGRATALLGSADALKSVGGLVGTLISAFFLFAVAAGNIVILRGVWRAFRHVRRGSAYADEDFDILLDNRGFLARIFRPLFRLVTKSWHMFPLGGRGQFAYITVGGLNEVQVFRTDDFSKIATIPTGKLPHGIWPSGDGSRVYVGLENDYQLVAIDTLTNATLASIPIGQAPQAVVYVPDAVPVGTGMNGLQPGEGMLGENAAAASTESAKGTQGLEPLGVAGQAAHLTLSPLPVDGHRVGAAASAPEPQTSVTLFDQGLLQVLEAAVTGLEPGRPYLLALSDRADGGGVLEGWLAS